MLFLLLAILGVVVAGYYDVRYRIIPNWLSFSLFFIGVAGNLFLGNIKPLLTSVGTMFLIGYALWKLGLWAAGDAKEFLFLSALLPKYPEELKQIFTPYIAPYPFPITILLNTFLASFPLLFAYALYLTIKKTKIEISTEKAKESLKNSLSFGYSAFFIGSLFFILSSFKWGNLLSGFEIYLSIPIILLASFYLKSLKLKLSTIFLAFILSLYLNNIQAFLMLSMVIFVAMILLKIFWRAITFLSRYGLYEEIGAENLKEGMILAEEIYLEGANGGEAKVVVGENVYKRVRGGREIIAASAARGLEKEEIERIKALANEGKIEKSIKIKKSMAFTPILFGLGLSLIFGDIAAMKVFK